MGSPLGGGGSPRISKGKLCFKIGPCLKNTSSISLLSFINISFSWSSKYCSKGSLGGTTIEARPIISSLLGNSLSWGCVGGKSASSNTYGAGARFRFGGERRLHKEQIVATHARKHAKILPSFGPHGCVKPYCCLSGLIRVLALERKKLQ